jgi:lipopolysaccharide transport system ATP-binding protein
MTAMADPAIVVERLSKCYRIPRADGAVGGWRRFVPWVGRAVESEAFWALRDVSFDVSLGQVVGIVGRNGSGKSTLLKILSRVVAPTSGQVAIRGRVGSLLEVGAGFHPELTGRENVYLSGAVLGMSRAEVGACFDEIVAFAEIERFLDAPVKRYSSGMYVRLAFSIAAHLDPEILLIDEALAVGDFAFQAKCIERMKRIAAEGRTILFVSHDVDTVLQLAHRVLVLAGSRPQFTGAPEEAVAHYKQLTLAPPRPLPSA